VQLGDLLDFVPPALEEGVPTPEPNPLEVALERADWVVFVMLDTDPEVPHSDAVKRFLAERPDVASNANVVVMAMGAPIYLDSTEISKLSAYYALYGTGEVFVDTAARALYQEILPSGASPVTVSGINYDILAVTSPDPAQVIELYAGAVPIDPEGENTPEPLELDPGDTLRVRTGVILDQNGNPVPDGTPVDFNINFVNEGLRTTQGATTANGVAQSSLELNREGQIEVTAVSEPAQISFTLFVNVGDTRVDVDVQPPEVTPTATEAPTEEPVGPEGPADSTPTPEPPVLPPRPPREGVSVADLMLTLLGLFLIGGVAFFVGQQRSGEFNDGLFYALPSLVGGLLVYNYYATGLSLEGGGIGGTLGVAVVAWGGGIIGFAVALAIVRGRNWRASRSDR
jgi:beta-N-acetylhexosaminidase